MIWIIIRNIKQFIKTHQIIFVLFVTSQVVTILSIMFVYSVFVSHQKQSDHYNQAIRTITLRPLTELDRSLEMRLKEILTVKGSLIRGIAVKLDNEESILANFTYSKRNSYYVHYGRYFSEEEFNRGGKNVILSDMLAEGKKKVGETFKIDQSEYKIIGMFTDMFYHEIPFKAIDNYHNITEIMIVLADPPTQRELTAWVYYLEERFPECDIAEPKARDLRHIALNMYRSFSSVSIGLLAVLNLSYLYYFILLKRKGSYAVMRMCGCNVLQGTLIHFSEVLLFSSTLFMISAAIFHFGISPLVFTGNNDYNFSMGIGEYSNLFLIYLAVLLAVFLPTITGFSRRMPVELWRKDNA